MARNDGDFNYWQEWQYDNGDGVLTRFSFLDGWSESLDGGKTWVGYDPRDEGEEPESGA